MSISARVTFGCKVTEELGDGSLNSAGDSLIHDAFDENFTITGSSTVPATKIAASVLALSAGAKTINLAALVSTNGITLDTTGLKLQVWRIKNLGAAAMAFTEGAANGYAALGTAFLFSVPAGGIAMFYLADLSPDVASGDRTIDVAGTASQTFENTMVFG